jgi:hypothetical protein
MIEQTARTTGEEALAGDVLALKASTSSMPERAADTLYSASYGRHQLQLPKILSALYYIKLNPCAVPHRGDLKLSFDT